MDDSREAFLDDALLLLEVFSAGIGAVFKSWKPFPQWKTRLLRLPYGDRLLVAGHALRGRPTLAFARLGPVLLYDDNALIVDCHFTGDPVPLSGAALTVPCEHLL